MKKMAAVLILSTLISAAPAQMPKGAHYYFYLSDQRIITLELLDAQKVILNYFNLGSTFEIIEAPMLVIVDAADNLYRGHLIEIEDSEDGADAYKVSDLMKPDQYSGYTILGGYQFRAPPEKAFFKVGSRIMELDPITPEQFDLVASRISELDFSLESGTQAVLMAGFEQGHGVLHPSGSPGAERLERYFPDSELLPPVLLMSPPPMLPEKFQGLPDPVVVSLKVIVTRAAGIHEVQVQEGIDPELDAMAVEAVQNAWTFLPAISRGEIVDTELTLKVVFRRER